jgi:TM2 domain-containing membrane protein YozV
MKFLIAFVLILVQVYILKPQTQFQDSAEYIYPFARYLYCSGDYFRASSEFQRLIGLNQNIANEDTINFLLGKSFQKLESFEKSNEYFSKFYKSKSPLMGIAIREYIKNQFLQKNYFYFYNIFSDPENYEWLDYFYTLKLAVKLRELNNSEIEKDLEQIKDVSSLLFIAEYISKMRLLKKKNPVIAGVLSAVIPGSGKIYTGKYSDGVISLLLIGLFGYLAYDNFAANHNFRGWLFAGLSSFFYAGNIYGSIISANIFNHMQKVEFRNELSNGLNDNNFFIDEVSICR